MLRLRLACLALASGMMVTASGCSTCCDSGPMFPRLSSSSWFAPRTPHADCECNSAYAPRMTEMPVGQGPFLVPPPTAVNQTMPIPITNIPPATPPQIMKVPPAPPTAYIPPTN